MYDLLSWNSRLQCFSFARHGLKVDLRVLIYVHALDANAIVEMCRSKHIPEDTEQWANAVLLLGQHRRRWDNIQPALGY